MTAFAEIDASKFVTRQIGRLDPPDFVGPDDATPAVEAGMTCRKLADNLSRTPPTPTSRLQWLDNEAAPVWIDPRTLDQARTDKVAELSTACGAQIVGGFISSALGAAYTYPSTVLDQHNLNGLVTRSLYAPAGWTEKFWCADSAGVWARREHTAAQLQQVGDEAITRITAAQAKCDILIAQANAAADAATLEAITWGAA